MWLMGYSAVAATVAETVGSGPGEAVAVAGTVS
jgi:hypothetical protein